MKVLMDIQSAVTQRAGVGRYTRELLEHLPVAMHPGNSLAGFYFDFKGNAQAAAPADVELKRCGWCPGRIAEQVWKRVNWPPYDWLSGKADIFHFPNFTARPVTAGHTVITVHDISFVRFPQFTEARNLSYLAARLPDSLKRAEAVITDSQFSADEIVDAMGVAEEKVFPIHLGISSRFAAPPEDALADFRKRHGLQHPYLLSVGTLEPRKNIPFLVNCFEQLHDFDGELVLAGTRGWLYDPILDRIKHSPCHNRIRLLEGLPDTDMPALYAAAELFVCASFYEGFGFPPLEAMACGTPVVSSCGGSLKETAGNAALLLDNFEVEAWVAEISRLLHDSTRRAELSTRGIEHAAGYRWEKTAQQTWQVYQRLTGDA